MDEAGTLCCLAYFILSLSRSPDAMTMEIYNDDGVSSRFCTIPAVASDTENDSTGNS
ncbi:hypothetical protein ALC53_07245 [Atta colombica]|uniref:Uncharacterized protein n=1 Tax=Atta colombica TaxID=520822 RepID=A0A195BDI4_9HYME|nr:hypothetical protein ALC53_07245 [Atta colombica]